MFLMCVPHLLVLFQALQDEVESYHSLARAAEKKLQRRELETHEQVPGAVPPSSSLGQGVQCLKTISCFKAKPLVFYIINQN